MSRETRISALISQTTKELPADVVVHPRLVVTRKSGEAILRLMASGKPTDALRKLLRDGD